jgi:DNA helicase-2/ATP-dependent DNA helicase PcrA
MDELLSKLNAPQREAVLHTEGPLLVLAGAGSGKTRVITCRIAHLVSQGVQPWNILAVTFTNKAAAEMRRRVDAICPGQGRAVWVSTFHSFCAQLLRVEAKVLGQWDSHFVIYDDADQRALIKEALQELALDDKRNPAGQILGAIGRAKDQMMDADSYGIYAQANADPFRERVASVYALYQKKLINANAMDFGDLIMRAVQALRDHESLREKYQKRFQYILIDEYQDTNHAQHLLAKSLVGPRKNICVVGDDDQSIYSWRGAVVRNILEFDKDYPGAKVVKLEQNYRCTRSVLEAAGKLIIHNEMRGQKILWTENPPGEPVHFQEHANETEEAQSIVGEIQRLKEGGSHALRDFAVFYRTNAQSRVFEDALRRAVVPYAIIGALKFYERMEIKDALAYARLVVNPRDNLALKRILNVPARGLGKTTLAALGAYAATQGLTMWEACVGSARVGSLISAARLSIQKFVALIEGFRAREKETGAERLIRRLLEESGYWDHLTEEVDSDPQAAERLDNLQELVNAAKDFEDRAHAEERPATLTVFLEEVSLMTDMDVWKGEGGSVTLMTVHLAKGLEFPAVFLTGLEEGLFPIGDSAFSQEELEEERRLAYVGMTRAKERLFLSCAASRKLFGVSRMNIPSRFIEEAGLAAAKPAAMEHSFSQGSRVSDDYSQLVDEGDEVTGRIKAGTRVNHPDFGGGKVISREGSGLNAKITVLFNSGARKKLLLRYAPLEIIR